ncbi:hypothetical protein CLI64_13410 [Nostoc sp. CENA543]|uniref:hypothetical protein n=1 Tax=Nostoc sp. CENA543 TaxID=1869241 RepID=UPI000CA0AF3F|nr:hypothetical protein [Nostoc sp. CENA543]AUT01318.1 hypothetical protein CLI64_13410 [Nostoc sp. CENA543]
MDVYTQDGNIIRQFPKDDGTTEIEIEFLFNDLFWSRLYGITIFYVAFYKRLHIDYVVSSHTFTKVVVKQSDFDDRAQQELIQIMLEIKENSNMLLGMAEKYLFDQPDSGNVETNRYQPLLSYKVTEVEGKEFLEKVAENL